MEGFSLDSSSSGTPNPKTSSFLYPLPNSSSTTSAPLSSPLHGHSYLTTNSSSCSIPYHNLQIYNSKSHEVGCYQTKIEACDQSTEAMKLKIMSHPQYSTLLTAFMDCQKVGAPTEAIDRLSVVIKEFEARSKYQQDDLDPDPELDQFMKAYCEMLGKYREELMRPFQEATEFLKRVELQFNALTNTSSHLFSADWKGEVSSPEDDQAASGAEAHVPEFDSCADDKDLKHQLLKKYSGYLGNLRQELSKKKKKGKLPKEARQKLLNWWELHYKWPYPSENDKIDLADSTGLDPKQINNWFINQRKRHWKPSEDMPFVVMDGFQPNAAAFFVEGQFMGDGVYRLRP